MKKLISIMLVFIVIVMPISSVMAIEAGKSMIAIGGDLTDSERAKVYEYFNVDESNVSEVDINIEDEKKYLESVDPSKIGSKSLSSIYVETKNEGDGLDIELNNIDWLTEEIYKNALITVGITDAKIIIAAPFNVSGTAALTGVFKAYEQLSGQEVSEDAKQTATEELVTTGNLSDDIGSEDAAAVVNDIKLAMSEIKDMDDESVKEEIENIANEHNVTLSSKQIEELLKLARSFENVDLSSVYNELKNISDKFGDSGFWDKLVEFFKGLFN